MQNKLEAEIKELMETLIPTWLTGSPQRDAYEQRLTIKRCWLTHFQGEEVADA